MPSAKILFLFPLIFGILEAFNYITVFGNPASTLPDTDTFVGIGLIIIGVWGYFWRGRKR